MLPALIAGRHKPGAATDIDQDQHSQGQVCHHIQRSLTASRLRLSSRAMQAAMLTASFEELAGPMLVLLQEWTRTLRSQGVRMLLALLLRTGPAVQARLVPVLAGLRAAAGALDQAGCLPG